MFEQYYLYHLVKITTLLFGDSGGGCNGQGVMVRRDMEVTEVVEEDAMDRVSC